MSIALLIYLTVINFSPAFSDSEIVHRNKRSEDSVPCEWGWYYFREKCYKAGGRKASERLTWHRALELCRSYGGDLVSIQSQEEQDFLISFLQLDIKFWAWTGLNNLDKEDNFKWADGSVFNYTNWNTGEPNGQKDDREEGCVHMLFEPENDIIGKWNDKSCSATDSYICEKNANNRKKSPNPIYCPSEAGGGWKFQSSCYHVVEEKMSWQNAERYCKNNYNGYLVTVLDTLVDSFLNAILSDMKNGLWIGIKIKNQLQQKWSSGWYVSYDGFNEQLNFVEGTCAARANRKEWITIPCSQKLSFICEVSKETPPVLKLPTDNSHCPKELDDWRDLGGEYCYYFETRKTVTFYEAIFDCKRRGGDLASLHSEEESRLLHQFVKYARFFGGYHIGLIRLLAREEEFGWTDGSAVNYENWGPNEPNYEADKCVEAVAHRGFTWNDISCTEKKGYICSVKKISTISTFADEDDCTSFCISQQSHLHALVNQSTDAKLCKTRCQK